MLLHQLLSDPFWKTYGGLPDVEITKVTADSRQVIPGAIFVAIRGSTQDGHQFLPQAVINGAEILIGEELDPSLGIPYLQVENSRLALAHLAAGWHGFPARKLIMIGVTGTDGKTTTANLIYKILELSGIRPGMITSVNAVIGERVLDTGLHVTTPDALEVQGYLAEMVSAGLTHCVLEATSHGLIQHRVSVCDFDIGVVTNITHEHLDYHGSYQAYLEAKSQLFASLSFSHPKPMAPLRTAILNRDDSSFNALRKVVRVREVSYGLERGADIVGENIITSPKGITFTAKGPWYREVVNSPLIGDYNVYNCLAAFAATVEGLGIVPEKAAQGIANLTNVAGRMEIIDVGQSFLAIVDFAHTPNALKRALKAARQLTRGRILAIFGSAGLRDREKRRMMAEVSLDLADLTVLTAEDPRTESLDAILDEMAQGARGKGGQEGVNFWRIPDRGEALRFAVKKAKEGDLVIACGKGHEQSMCFGEVEYPWDDRVAMRAALTVLLGIQGPNMPHLPTTP
jgi:UDP-N-acetylmuramoyl-L-alanyl-D-glutamate--2,6-diaminopimelate ligase